MKITGWVETKLLDYWDQPDYWEESWRHEETCCHSNFSERQSANANGKNFQGIIIIMIKTSELAI